MAQNTHHVLDDLPIQMIDTEVDYAGNTAHMWSALLLSQRALFFFELLGEVQNLECLGSP